MSRLAFALSLAVAALVLALSASQALACSCEGGTIKDRYKRADAVMVAELVEAEQINEMNYRLTYEVRDVYKRRYTFQPGDSLVLRTPSQGTACGLPRGINREYGLFLSRWRGEWTANLCTLIGAERLRRWGERHRPGGGEGELRSAGGGLASERVSAREPCRRRAS